MRAKTPHVPLFTSARNYIIVLMYNNTTPPLRRKFNIRHSTTSEICFVLKMLCNVCKNVFANADWSGLESSGLVLHDVHHRNLDELVQSANAGCQICFRLKDHWEAEFPDLKGLPLGTHALDGSFVYCHLYLLPCMDPGPDYRKCIDFYLDVRDPHGGLAQRSRGIAYTLVRPESKDLF